MKTIRMSLRLLEIKYAKFDIIFELYAMLLCMHACNTIVPNTNTANINNVAFVIRKTITG